MHLGDVKLNISVEINGKKIAEIKPEKSFALSDMDYRYIGDTIWDRIDEMFYDFKFYPYYFLSGIALLSILFLIVATCIWGYLKRIKMIYWLIKCCYGCFNYHDEAKSDSEADDDKNNNTDNQPYIIKKEISVQCDFGKDVLDEF